MEPFILLEKNYLSKSDRESIVEKLTVSGILLDQEFETYMMHQLSNNIKLDKFENLARNIFNYYELATLLRGPFVEFIATSYLKDNFHDYFQHLVKFDKRRFAVPAVYSLEFDIIFKMVNRIIFHVSHNYRIEESLQWLKRLAQDTSYKYHTLLCFLGEDFIDRGDKVRVLFLVDALDVVDKYELLGTSLYNKSIVFDEVEASLSEDNFFEYTKEHINDDSLLCHAIKNSQRIDANLAWLNKGSLLKKLMLENPSNIMQTLEHILQIATNDRFFDIVIQLGSCLSKKKILGILTSQENSDHLVDKFFFLYKDYPEVKNLAPFI